MSAQACGDDRKTVIKKWPFFGFRSPHYRLCVLYIWRRIGVMPSMLGIVLGVLFASGTTLGAWYVAFDAGMVRNDPASAIAGAAGVFAYYDDEEDSAQGPDGTGDESWRWQEEDSAPGPDGTDDGSWWWEDDDVEVEVDVEDDNGGSWWWEDDDGDIEPSYDDEIYIEEPYYYDDVEEYEVIDEW